VQIKIDNCAKIRKLLWYVLNSRLPRLFCRTEGKGLGSFYRRKQRLAKNRRGSGSNY